MNTIIQVAHDLKSNTLEVTWFDEVGNRGCQNFHPLQIDNFKQAAGEHAQKYIDLAGWTPEYIAQVLAEEKRLAEETQAKAGKEEAERQKAGQKRFNDAVAAGVKEALKQAKKE